MENIDKKKLPIKTVHIGKYYHPYSGGIETVLRGIVRSTAVRGDMSVRVMVYNNRPKTVVDMVDNVPIRRLSSLGVIASQPICFNMPYWLTKEKPDILNIHLPNPLANISCLLAKVRCPLVLSYHSDIVKQSLLRIPYLSLLKKVLKRADRIVVATPNHIKYSQILPQYEDKCTVIPYGIDLSRFSMTPEIEKRCNKIKKANPGPTLLFIGRLVYYKGLEYLIRSMKAVNAKLFVIGSGPLESQLKTLNGSTGLEKRITFLGWVEEQEKLAYLHACDLLILPSVEPSEAFGMVQIEAMACSKPVVSTDLPSGVPYVNKHGQTGLVVKPKDSSALTGAINVLLNDSDLRKRFGQNGRNLAETEYAEEVMGQRYYELYCQLLGKSKRQEVGLPTAATVTA